MKEAGTRAGGRHKGWGAGIRAGGRREACPYT